MLNSSLNLTIKLTIKRAICESDIFLEVLTNHVSIDGDLSICHILNFQYLTYIGNHVMGVQSQGIALIVSMYNGISGWQWVWQLLVTREYCFRVFTSQMLQHFHPKDDFKLYVHLLRAWFFFYYLICHIITISFECVTLSATWLLRYQCKSVI